MNESPAIPVQEKSYIPALDGLRGLAILLVLTYHSLGSEIAVFRLGWTGVDLFFVLSGYLITNRLVANINKPNRYGRFYRNRILRIMPLYYLTLIIFFVSINFLVQQKNFHRFDYYKENWVSFFLFLQNWAFIFKGIPIEHALQHFWSLAIEEQFYLLWPLILYTLYSQKRFISYVLLLVVIIITARHISYQYTGSAVPDYFYYYHTFFRADAFLIGALIFLFIHKGVSIQTPLNIIMGVSFLLLLICILRAQSVTVTNPFFGRIGYTAFDLIFAGVLFYIITRPFSWINKIFDQTFLKFTGKISYGLYIIHFPVLMYGSSYIAIFLKQHFSMNDFFANIGAGSFCLLVIFVLSTISYYFFESWFLKRKI